MPIKTTILPTTRPASNAGLWTIAPSGQLRVRPHPGQLTAWDSPKRFVFMLAGTQGGKTSFGPLWLYREIRLRGPGDYLAVTSTFPLLKLKMLPEFLRLFGPAGLQLGTWHASDRVFQFHDGQTRVIFGSAHNPESLESATAKAAWLDEVGQDDFRLGSWEAILRRLALHQGRVLAGTTIYNLGWLKQQIYDPQRAGHLPDTEIVQFDSLLNPAFPRAEFDRAQAVLPDWKFRMFYRGQFDRPAGMIYSAFVDRYREDGGHKVRPFAIPPDWPRSVGIDFGAVHTALIWLAHDPAANVYYLYRESLDGNKTSAQHAADALTVAAGVNVRTWFGGAKGETQQRMDWNAAGVPIHEPPISDVEAGIDRVIGLFKTFRLYIVDSCQGVLDEIGSYSRALDELNQPTEVIKNKATYHRLDALRYVVSGVDAAPAYGASADREPVISRPSVRMWGR